MTEKPARHAVVLANLGTPEAPTAAALRPWLAEFLGDERVVDMQPRWLWWLILHGVILRTRPRQSAHAYRQIWTTEGSPLRIHSEQLATALARHLADDDAPRIRVELAMRYGRPRVQDVMARLTADGVRKILLLPLYPQYSATSTGSVLDAAADALQQLRWPPELRIVNAYHTHPAWLDALAESVHNHWQAQGRGDKLLLSFHGIPERYVRLGDPYLEHCRATTAALRQRLGLAADELQMTFQSRVGREEWLKPYTDATVRELGAAGTATLDVLCPGFAVDCLETLEEIAIRNDGYFRDAGGKRLRYIPALNASQSHARALAALVRDYTRDWTHPDPQQPHERNPHSA